MKHLETQRLLLRPIELNDAPSLFTFWSDPNVSKHMNIETFSEVTQAEQMILLLQKLSVEQKACRWTILLKHTSQVIGSCGFNYFDFENERTEIGYDLGYPFWGNGYIPEALQSLISFGFHELGLNRIEAKVEPENINSLKVLKKLHFVEEGTLRQYEKSKGQLVDLIMFSVLRNDWIEHTNA
ncbi:GNAT family N-acetyltransferase [Brevibacillus choshinensis]|uniref:GNAT family N-acetyltransferase n=1 Tax=Brevibacillus choshinensis TaxID=54911 RepID=A0ABX7FY73_BRECH|nr:GNAT family protein [Brevibacillus choshinensis]QRG70750.1 GNAT family N-acetyltransferase [Brevibacillus choshinensis]